MSGLTCQKQLGAATAKDPSPVASLVCRLSGLRAIPFAALPNIQDIVGAAIADIAISIRGARPLKGPEDETGARRSAERQANDEECGRIEPSMKVTRAQREANKSFRQASAERVMSEHEIAQIAFAKNRERLKAERLAREARGDKPLAKARP